MFIKSKNTANPVFSTFMEVCLTIFSLKNIRLALKIILR